MICNVCGKKKATVHLTEIVDGQTTELHICEGCAKEKSLQMEQQFGLADLLAGLSDFGKSGAQKEQKETASCTNCQLTYEDFRKMGRLGCSQCYQAFSGHLATLLKKIHGSNKHLGKKPVRLTVEEAPVKPKKKGLSLLKQQLLEAIEKENFEQAAEIRDQIRAMEKRGES